MIKRLMAIAPYLVGALAVGGLLAVAVRLAGGVRPLIHLLGTIGLIGGGAAATVFVVLYHLSARWWTSEEGWHLMSFTGAIAAVEDYTAIRTLTVTPRPISLTVDISRLVIFGLVGGLLVWRLWMLYRIQVRSSRRRS